jgi:hypothetical protein
MKLKRKEREIKKNMKKNNYSYIILCLNANLGVISLGQPSLENCESRIGDHFCRPILGNHARLTSTTTDRQMRPQAP